MPLLLTVDLCNEFMFQPLRMCELYFTKRKNTMKNTFRHDPKRTVHKGFPQHAPCVLCNCKSFWKYNACRVRAIWMLWWLNSDFLFPFQQLFIFSASLQFKEDWGPSNINPDFNKDGCRLLYRSTLMIFSCWFLPRPPGIHAAHISAHLWDEHLQQSGNTDPLKLFTYLNHHPDWCDMQSLCCWDWAVL